jgi:hypothetical protein
MRCAEKRASAASRACRPIALAPRRVGRQLAERVGQRRLVHRHQQAGLALVDHRRHAADLGGHDRQRARHRLRQHQRQTLAARRQREHVERRHDLIDVHAAPQQVHVAAVGHRRDRRLDVGARRALADQHQLQPPAQVRRQRPHQQHVVLELVEPADAADHPGVVGDAERQALLGARPRVGREALEPDAVGDDVQLARRAVMELARLGRGDVGHRDEGVGELGGGPAQQPVAAAAGISPVFGVDAHRADQPRRGRAIDERQRIVGMHHVGAEAAQAPRELHRERGIEPVAARDLVGGDAGGRELARQRPRLARGLRRQRHHVQRVPGLALADRQIERDALLAADAVRREHVDDGGHAIGYHPGAGDTSRAEGRICQRQSHVR